MLGSNMSRTAVVKVPACRRTLIEPSVDKVVDVGAHDVRDLYSDMKSCALQSLASDIQLLTAWCFRAAVQHNTRI